MAERWWPFLCLFCVDAYAAACADGALSFVRNGDFVASMNCGDMVDLGSVDAERFPDAVCGAGVRNLKSSTGVSVSLYSAKYTERAICVAVNDAVCYANLVPDDGVAGALRVRIGDVVYRTKDVSWCLDVDAENTATLVRSNVNSVNWSSLFQSGTVRGISHCSNQAGVSNSVSEDLTVSSAEGANYWCWCRAVMPVLSYWVFGMEFASDENCTKYCAARCAEVFAEDANFRNTMLHNIYSIDLK